MYGELATARSAVTRVSKDRAPPRGWHALLRDQVPEAIANVTAPASSDRSISL